MAETDAVSVSCAETEDAVARESSIAMQIKHAVNFFIFFISLCFVMIFPKATLHFLVWSFGREERLCLKNNFVPGCIYIYSAIVFY